MRILTLVILILCCAGHISADGPTTDGHINTPSNISATSALNIKLEHADSTMNLAKHYLSQSRFMTATELDHEIRAVNHLGEKTQPKAGANLIIPGLEPQPIVEHTRGDAKDADFRAIYFTGGTAGSVNGIEKLRRWHDLGGNAVVFDIKDSDGSTSIAFNHPLAPVVKSPHISNLPKYVRFIHSLGMHAIARIALFRDESLVTRHHELAVQSHSSKEPWRENGKLVWTDSSNPAVQEYNIALAKYVAQSGVDEVQFDYVRFPAEGDQRDASFHYQQLDKDDKPSKLQRKDVIVDFLEHAYTEVHHSGALLSVDVFGVMAWQRNVDLASTGQDIPAMARHCDVMSPMIYPSHFFGMDGYERPGDAPDHFIRMSMERFRKVTTGSGVVIRPWLQAFGWRTKTYSPDYIRIQVAATRDTGGIGYLFWNANNDYSVPNKAMPQMMAGDFKIGATKTEKVAIAHATTDDIVFPKSRITVPQLRNHGSLHDIAEDFILK